MDPVAAQQLGPRGGIICGSIEASPVCIPEAPMPDQAPSSCHCAANYHHHHYHEIRQAANGSETAALAPVSPQSVARQQLNFCDSGEPNPFVSCDCCGNISPKPSFVLAPHHHHHHHHTQLSSRPVLREVERISRVMSSSSENLQSSSEETSSKRKKP